MLKVFIKILFAFAISILVILPTLISFYGQPSKRISHLSCSAKEKCLQPHLTHGIHDNSWNLIKNSQLSTPPGIFKIKAASIISLLFAVCFISLALITSRRHLVFPVFQGRLFPECQIFLVYRVLLI
jgi:hypothetical protein